MKNSLLVGSKQKMAAITFVAVTSVIAGLALTPHLATARSPRLIVGSDPTVSPAIYTGLYNADVLAVGTFDYEPVNFEALVDGTVEIKDLEVTSFNLQRVLFDRTCNLTSKLHLTLPVAVEVGLLRYGSDNGEKFSTGESARSEIDKRLTKIRKGSNKKDSESRSLKEIMQERTEIERLAGLGLQMASFDSSMSTPIGNGPYIVAIKAEVENGEEHFSLNHRYGIVKADERSIDQYKRALAGLEMSAPCGIDRGSN